MPCRTGYSKKDGIVRVNDLAMYAREKVPQRTNDRQHPILETQLADNFAVAYFAAGESNPKELPFTSNLVIENMPGQFNREIVNSGIIDKEADVLYLSFGEPVYSEVLENGSDALIRFNPETNEMTGVTILNLSDKILNQKL